MDLLGSILGSMDKPPSTGTPLDAEAKKKMQDAKLKAAKLKEDDKKRKALFRSEIEARVTAFLQSPDGEKILHLEPMDHLHRSIAHDVAEIAGLPAYSFGEEGTDRHLVIWKKEFAPSEEELEAMRNGEEWNPALGKRLASEAERRRQQAESVGDSEVRRKRAKKDAEDDPYMERYAKMLGRPTGLGPAEATKSNTAYGMVPSRNKEDRRSIEQTLKEIRDRKKLKPASTSSGNSDGAEGGPSLPGLPS